MSKTALRNALFAWLALLLGAALWSLRPAKLPAWTLPVNDGSSASLLDLQGKPVGVLVYASRTACGGHAQTVSESVALFRMLKESSRYSMHLVFGDLDEAKAREFAEKYVGIPIMLDPGKRLADELGFDYSGFVLYRPNGSVILKNPDHYLLAQEPTIRILDEKTR